MAKENFRRIACRRKPYPWLSSNSNNETKPSRPKKHSETLKKNGWQEVTCCICMEYPHKAVLLLCSSHSKGCLPYMCGTSFRYSNCLDQYNNACAKATTKCNNHPTSKATELSCALCRGQVKGWTVVKPAREYLNAKTRSCVQDNCSFVGTYRELRKHTKANHWHAKPQEAGPTSGWEWTRVEDAMSSFASTYEDMGRNLMSVIQFFEAIDSNGDAVLAQYSSGNNFGTSLNQRLRRRGLGLLGRSGRRRVANEVR